MEASEQQGGEIIEAGEIGTHEGVAFCLEQLGHDRAHAIQNLLDVGNGEVAREHGFNLANDLCRGG